MLSVEKRFEWYHLVTKESKEGEDVQVSTLITLLDHKGLPIYETLTWNQQTDAKKIKCVLDKFTTHFEPKKSQTYERYEFLTRHQQEEGESCKVFILEFQSLVATCEYATWRKLILRDQVSMGVADNNPREKQLFDTKFTLDRSIEIYRACETSSVIAEKLVTESVNQLSKSSGQKQHQAKQKQFDTITNYG